jgi:hypothetical protein
MGGRAFSFYGDDSDDVSDMMGGRAFSFYKQDKDMSDSESGGGSDSDSEDGEMGGARRRARRSRSARKTSKASKASTGKRSKSAGRKIIDRGLPLFNRILQAHQKASNGTYKESQKWAKKKFDKFVKNASARVSATTLFKKATEDLKNMAARRGSRRGSRRASRRTSRRGSRRTARR